MNQCCYIYCNHFPDRDYVINLSSFCFYACAHNDPVSSKGGGGGVQWITCGISVWLVRV